VTLDWDTLVREHADRVGVSVACRAFGVNERSFRHRRSRARRRAVNVTAAAHVRSDGDDTAIMPAAAGGIVADSGEIVSDSASEPGDADGMILASSNVGMDAVLADGVVRDAVLADGVAPVVRHAFGNAAVMRAAARVHHPAALTTEERIMVLDLLCSSEFCDDSPTQVFHKLLNRGVYVCSVRTMYRLLVDHGLAGDRRRGGHRSPGRFALPIVHATAPNRAWSWDITKLRGNERGVSYFLYTIMDIYSRLVVGWRLAHRESGSIAEHLFRVTTRTQRIRADQLIVHADRGGPMMSGTLTDLLESLSIAKTHSRPRVSNDNPFSEAQFKTMKFRPDYPTRFESFDEAHGWCTRFFAWYNDEHRHSGIGFLTPRSVHEGSYPEIVAARQVTLDAAYAAHPQRFRAKPEAKRPPTEAWINKPTIKTS
jgi:putative transposase